MTTGGLLKALRNQRKMTRQQLSGKTGIAVITLREYEADKYKPKIEQAEKLAAAFQVPLHFLQTSSIYENLDNVEAAMMSFDNECLSAPAYQGLITMLAETFGGMEERVITGRFGSTDIYVFGCDDEAIALSGASIKELQKVVKSILGPITRGFKGALPVDVAVKEYEDYLNSPEAEAALKTIDDAYTNISELSLFKNRGGSLDAEKEQ